MLKKVGVVVAAVIAVFLLYIALQSPDYSVTRKIAINAPAEKIFPYLNNSKLAEQWGPWASMDPDSKMSYSGPDEGVGSVSRWSGGKQMGTGSATIVESIPNTKVGIRIEYTEPMGMTQNAQYLVEPSGEQTAVTWSVSGQNNFVGRLMCAFVNMDKMVGGMFETGLANLKTVVEKS